MVTYIIRRLLLVPVLLFGVTILIFGMLQFLAPVERASLYIRRDLKTEHQINAIIKRYCLDSPIYMQYWNWLIGTIDSVSGEREGGILFGNFGWSKTGSQPVSELIKHRFPNTLDLTLWAIGPVILIGIWLGVQAAVHHNGLIDQGRAYLQYCRNIFPDLCVRIADVDDLLCQPAVVPAGPPFRRLHPGCQFRSIQSLYDPFDDRYAASMAASIYFLMPCAT